MVTPFIVVQLPSPPFTDLYMIVFKSYCPHSPPWGSGAKTPFPCVHGGGGEIRLKSHFSILQNGKSPTPHDSGKFGNDNAN